LAWRELISLTHDGYYNPTLSNTAGTGKWSEGDPFFNEQSYYYWSSTTYASSADYTWLVYMDDGSVFGGNRDFDYYVWPVSGGQ
jgi:hypothetical protein